MVAANSSAPELRTSSVDILGAVCTEADGGMVAANSSAPELGTSSGDILGAVCDEANGGMVAANSSAPELRTSYGVQTLRIQTRSGMCLLLLHNDNFFLLFLINCHLPIIMISCSASRWGSWW